MSAMTLSYKSCRKEISETGKRTRESHAKESLGCTVGRPLAYIGVALARTRASRCQTNSYELGMQQDDDYVSVRTIPPKTRSLGSAINRLTSRDTRDRSGNWHRVVAELRRQQPFCVVCAANGIQTVATETDHKTPISRGGTNDVANLQRLCTPCHRDKSLHENDRQYVY